MDFRHSAVALGRRIWPAKARGGIPQTNLAAERFRQPEDHWLSRLVGEADLVLRRFHDVREFTARRTCLFRIAHGHAPRELVLKSGGAMHKGDPIIELHLWNEHFPRIPAGGVDLAWGRQMRKRLHESLCDLALFMEDDSETSTAVAIWARGAIARAGSAGALVRIGEGFGFEVLRSPEKSAAEQFIEWFCDFWILLLVLAFNPRSLTADLLFRPHYELWISRDDFFRRFGRYAAARPSGSP